MRSEFSVKREDIKKELETEFSEKLIEEKKKFEKEAEFSMSLTLKKKEAMDIVKTKVPETLRGIMEFSINSAEKLEDKVFEEVDKLKDIKHDVLKTKVEFKSNDKDLKTNNAKTTLEFLGITK